MKKLLLIISITILTLTLGACTQSETETLEESRNLPGLTDELSISGEIVNKRDHDFSVQIKNEEGTSDWISVGIEIDNGFGKMIKFDEITIGQEVGINCLDSDCENVGSVSIFE